MSPDEAGVLGTALGAIQAKLDRLSASQAETEVHMVKLVGIITDTHQLVAEVHRRQVEHSTALAKRLQDIEAELARRAGS